jgi:hypothetical protein
MTKQEFMKANAVNQMPRLVQVMAGRLYDAAYEEGRAAGFRQGVDHVAEKQEEVYSAMYEKGAKDATHRGSAAFTIAACMVLHDWYGFRKKRLNRVVDGIADRLLHMFSPSEAVELVRSWGVHVEYEDELMGG